MSSLINRLFCSFPRRGGSTCLVGGDLGAALTGAGAGGVARPARRTTRIADRRSRATLPFALVGYVQVTVILILGRLVFDVPIRGNVALLYLITAPFIIASLALGLFVSTVVRTQVQAMQLSFVFIPPTVLLSGFMFPREAMPAFAQWLGAAFPITYYRRVLRGILLSVGLDALWRETLALAAFAVVLLAFSVRRFQKNIE